MLTNLYLFLVKKIKMAKQLLECNCYPQLGNVNYKTIRLVLRSLNDV